MMTTGELYLNGVWVCGQGASLRSENPASGEVIWQGGSASVEQLEAAIVAAREAFPAWAATPLEGRLEIIERYRALLETHNDAFAERIAKETGKPLWDAQGEVSAMLGKISISTKAYDTRTGYGEVEQGGIQLVLRHRPHGVMAVFGPYNFPGHLPNGHIIPALIAGNTVVL